MKPVKIDLIAAARPNFMKVAPLLKALRGEVWCQTRLVHTGQHYDTNMSDAFFHDLGLPAPDVQLGVGSGSHAEQTAGVMLAYERACLADRPDWAVVVGDVNSTLACTITATKLGVKVAHLEAGLRSGDRTMPEELNRLATDALADLLWTPSADADENLLREGISPERIALVGNIMIDSLVMMRPSIEKRRYHDELGLPANQFGVITLHRPSNVDDPARLSQLVSLITAAALHGPVVFPVHPRTRLRLANQGLLTALTVAGVTLLEPAGYVDFMSLVFNARYVFTDSGGVQEETTYLGVPCLTLRDSTERPVTVSEGTNKLVTMESVRGDLEEVFAGRWKKGRIPHLWDGQAAVRVVSSLRQAAVGGDSS